MWLGRESASPQALHSRVKGKSLAQKNGQTETKLVFRCFFPNTGNCSRAMSTIWGATKTKPKKSDWGEREGIHLKIPIQFWTGWQQCHINCKMINTLPAKWYNTSTQMAQTDLSHSSLNLNMITISSSKNSVSLVGFCFPKPHSCLPHIYLNVQPFLGLLQCLYLSQHPRLSLWRSAIIRGRPQQACHWSPNSAWHQSALEIEGGWLCPQKPQL